MNAGFTRDEEKRAAPSSGGFHRGHQGNELLRRVEMRIWPTPTAGDAQGSGSRNTEGSLAHAGVSLTDAVRGDGGKGRTWATPTCRDAETEAKAKRGAGSLAAGASAATMERNARPLNEQVVTGGAAPKGMQLNAEWVEWLMQFPRNWTSLEPLPPASLEAWLRGSWWAVDPADTGEVSRVTSSMPNRRARLRALGNAQVPSCAALAWRALVLEGIRP